MDLYLKKLAKEFEYLQWELYYIKDCISRGESIVKSDILKKIQDEYNFLPNKDEILSFLKNISEENQQENQQKNQQEKVNNNLSQNEILKDENNEDESLIKQDKINYTKILYRKIAKVAHPDVEDNFYFRNLFDQASEFYQKGENNKMVFIALLLNIEIEDIPPVKELNEELEKLKNEISLYKNSFYYSYLLSEDQEKEEMKENFILSNIF